ncbi:hypothetical protein M0D69_13905 [Caballeronia sp. SEWSISQ10-4 2]|uniref:hypothetical protein n=1 Tax=Caballeronia sp. SEWSISQ10-4 2 TaxID=2937438 RepID=UPI002653F600|nr:hypothetical protein [Caballeronia sp. SEWSISQ10-4 2]MDN7179088.1 hypothetical protein [Caballeronia sp. SEWSISQ10-4 2]
MMNSGRRVVLAGLASIGSMGSAIGRSLRDAGASVVGITPPRTKNEHGLPVHERIARTSGKAISVAQGKRNATKARNVKRHRAAVERAAR